MPLPPPPPASADRERMIRELEGAETDDLLALCQRFSRSAERLQLYASVFRRRQSASAQLAASLLCFDLARQGNIAATLEFATLAPSLEPLARDEQRAEGLLGPDPWLRSVWSACRASLQDATPSPAAGELELDLDVGEVLELDLLSGDVDLEWLPLELEPVLELEAEPEPDAPATPPPPPDPVRREAAAQTDRLLLEHLGISSARGFEPGRAFGLRTGSDADALERFVASLEPLCETCDAAAGLRFLLRMQLALAQRRTGLFGRTNTRRRALLTEALRAFPARHEALASAELLRQLGDAACRLRLDETVAIVANWTAFAARSGKAPAEVVAAFLEEAER